MKWAYLHHQSFYYIICISQAGVKLLLPINICNRNYTRYIQPLFIHIVLPLVRNISLNTKSVSLLDIPCLKVLQYPLYKEWNQLTPAGIYVSWLLIGSKQYKCYCRRSSLSDFYPYNLEFCRFSDGPKLNSSPQCHRSFLRTTPQI